MKHRSVPPLAFAAFAVLARLSAGQPAGRVSDPWEPEIRAFEAADRAGPPAPGGVVFLGSSSIRLWKDLADDFPATPVVNRGFGGSQISDSVRFFDRIVVPLRPRMVVLYAGDNDLAEGKTPEQVLADFQRLVATARRSLAGVRIAFLSIKPSPARAGLIDRMGSANTMVRDYTATQRDLVFIDVFTPMLNAGGRPRVGLFGPDGLHMNRRGYELWKGIIAPYLASP
jgi:lysophospholipase L1-like esterase